MELFPAQPDLSLRISPPNSEPSSSWKEEESTSSLGFWRISNLDTTTTTTSKDNVGSGFDQHLHFHDHHPFIHGGYNNQGGNQQEHDHVGSMKPIRGIPVYHTLTSTPSQLLPCLQQPHPHFCESSSPTTASGAASSNPLMVGQAHHSSRSRIILPSRYPGKRSIRAPRMRWTSTLHGRFVHAVELLGGHERATPKSVLELMDVKDLTLAHVKSHLQMYRTVKSTERSAASSGQSDGHENLSSVEVSDDNLFEIQNLGGSQSSIQQGRSTSHSSANYSGLWSNSSRGGWSYGMPKDFTTGSIHPLEKNMQLNNSNMVSNLKLCVSEVMSQKKPNLEFTLGRP